MRNRRKRFMTKAEAVREFRQYFMPVIRRDEKGRNIDYGRRQQDWAFYVDSLQRDGRVSMSQSERWSNPPFVVPPWRR